jgi:pyruvate dehydrogenase E1 component
MLPFYIYYSMFGFQRIGDFIWAAGDQRARGFLVGATAGRTTLGGEGLQHQDGQSHLMAATVPNCRAYDPAFASELAVILDHGMREMLEQDQDVFYYLTVMNENYPQPSLPEGIERDIISGMYHHSSQAAAKAQGKVRLLGSGTIMLEVLAAAELLASDWSIDVEIWSVTSFTELAREARGVERWNRLHPLEPQRRSHVATCLDGDIPVVAATDYVRGVPQLIASYISPRFIALGTDGYGRSDTRTALRDFFEVDRKHIIVAVLSALVQQGAINAKVCAEAIGQYGLDTENTPSWEC